MKPVKNMHAFCVIIFMKIKHIFLSKFSLLQTQNIFKVLMHHLVFVILPIIYSDFNLKKLRYIS